MNIEQTIRDYLPKIIHISLATCVNNCQRFNKGNEIPEELKKRRWT